MLSGGAFTGCFNYLQLAKGLACSLPLFVCSLQGICAERERAAAFRTEKKGTRSLGPIHRASLNLLLQDALPPEASSGREGKLYPAANSVGPSLRICRGIVFVSFVCFFGGYLSVHARRP